jgi:hypothetical protein
MLVTLIGTSDYEVMETASNIERVRITKRKIAARSRGKYSEEDPNALGNQGCWLPHLGPQGEVKGCTSAIVGSRPQLPAMRLDNGTTDG